MKHKRILRKIPLDFKLIAILFLIGMLGYSFYFIPPMNIVVVIGIILLATLITYLISSYFVAKKFQYIAAFSLFLFLFINYLVGFDILNTVLLVSFIIGLALIVK